MWQPRIKIKNTLNHSTGLFASYLPCSHQFNTVSPPFDLVFLCFNPVASSSFSILQIILIKLTMSKQDSNNQSANPYLINTYGKSTSRLNKNWLNNQTPRVSNPVVQKQPTKESGQKEQQKRDTYQQLMPRKISQLSPSVIFQDADGRQATNVQSQLRRNQNINRQSQQKPAQVAPLGLISNAFMGATTKYRKIDPQLKISTPNKTLEQDEHSPSYKKSQTTSQASNNKFSRKREIRQPEPKIETLKLNDQADSTSQPHTDRSNLEGRRIERKQDRGKVLKTMNKKDTNGSDRVSQHEGSTLQNPGESKLTKQTLSHIIDPTEQTDQFSTPTSKPYKPIQRQNPSRSRVLSEKSQIQSHGRQTFQRIVTNQSSNIIERKTAQNNNEIQAIQNKPQSIQRKSYNPTKVNQQESQQEIKYNTLQAKQTEQTPKSIALNPKIAGFSRVQEIKKVENKSETKINLKQEQPTPQQNRKSTDFKKSQSSLSPDHSLVTTQRINTRKSGAIGYIIKRLLKFKMALAFKHLSSFSRQDRTHKVNECSILAISLKQIIKAKQQNLLLIGFNQLRKKFTANCLQQAKQNTKQLANPLNAGCRLLEIIFNSKVRIVFKNLADKIGVTNKIKPYLFIDLFLKNKQLSLYRSGFFRLQHKAKQRICVLNNLHNVMNAFYSQHTLICFNNLKNYYQIRTQPLQKQPKRSFVSSKIAISQQLQSKSPSPALIEKEQKLKALNASISQSLTILETDISNSKKQRQQFTSEFSTKIDILRQRNQEFQGEVTNKRNQNQKISKELLRQPSKAPDHQIQLALQPETTKLDAITQIYISNYKNQQQFIRVQDIISDYSLESEDSSVLKEWDLFFKNNELKRIINSYEETPTQVSKARQVVMEEQQMILKLLRSYIKQQYFWQWLHISVQSL